MMRKLLLYCFIAILLYCFIGLTAPSPVLAQLPSFTWIVTNQNGYPLQGAVVWINLNGNYIATCTTGISGHCSESISCSPPCSLSGDVDWQGQTGHYGGSYLDGAIISVTISVPSPSPPPPGPSPSPPISPSPSPYPSPPPSPPVYSPAGVLHCIPGADGDPDSRPYRNVGPPEDRKCDLCNMTGMYCPSCATSFTVGMTVSWQWFQKNCENGGIWWIAEWGGNVIIDPTQTTIPFVGKKGNEDEKLYLADYFDGTNEYYYKQTRSYHRYWLDWIDHAGVWRKLTPMGYQDILKEEMVERAVAATPELREGNIHNYEVDFIGRICWDLPFLAEAFTIFLKNFAIDIPGSGLVRVAAEEVANKAHWCVFSDDVPGPYYYLRAINLFNAAINEVIPGDFLNISYSLEERATDRLASLDGHFPPQPDEENYVERWQVWKESRWGRLWTATPMSSREDTPGWIRPYYAYKYRDEPKYFEPRVEKVPHVARLYESTQEIQDMLFPVTEEEVTGQKEENPFCSAPQTSEPIIAAPAQQDVQGARALLAQGGSLWVDFQIDLTRMGVGSNQYSLCWTIVPHASGGCDFSDWGYCVDGVCEPRLAGYAFAWSLPITCHDGTAHPISVTANPGDTVCATFNITDGQCRGSCCEPDPRPSFTQTSCCEIDENGDPVNCGPGGAPSPPACEIPPSTISVPNCAQDSITDDNPNDDLCCDEISLGMTFYDSFYDHDPNDYLWMECIYETICGCPVPEVCDETGCYCPVPVECERVLLNPECKTWVHKVVSRRWGIDLSHPYLTQIWEQTAKNESDGVFNIFRPFEIPEFEELDAHSFIDYEFTNTWPSEGWERPSDGKFYFNYLGGVQKAKEWVTTKELMPYEE